MCKRRHIIFFFTIISISLFAQNKINKLNNYFDYAIHETLSEPYKVNSISFSPDGNIIACGAGKSISLWEVETGKHIMTMSGHQDEVLSVEFAPNGKYLASGSKDKFIRFWDASTGNPTYSIENKNWARVIKFCPDGGNLASISLSDVLLWDLQTAKLLKTFSEPGIIIFSFDVSPYGNYLAIGGENKKIKLWSTSTEKVMNTYKYESDIISICYSPDGNYLANACDDNMIYLVELQTNNKLKIGEHLKSVKTVYFSPDGNYLASGGGDKIIKLWDIKKMTLAKTLLGHSNVINTVKYSLDGRYFASGDDDGKVIIWKNRNANELTKSKINSEFILDVTKKNIATMDLDGIGISNSEVLALTNRLRSELFNTERFVVLEREKMEIILKEQGFQQTGCTSADCIVEAGKLLNVQLMIGGSVSRVSNLYSIELRLIDVKTGRIINVATEDYVGDIKDVLTIGIKNAVMKLTK